MFSTSPRRKPSAPFKSWDGYVILTQQYIAPELPHVVGKKKATLGPAQAKGSVSEDAYINKQLQMTGAVSYNGVAISQGGKQVSPIEG